MPNPIQDPFHRPPPFPPSSDRSFGLVFAGFFLLVGVWPLLRGNPVRWWGAGVSAAFLLAALLAPGLLRPLNVVWARIGGVLNKITTPIFTLALFYILFTPVGALRRLLGSDAMRRKPSADASYWIQRQPPGPAPESMSQQF